MKTLNIIILASLLGASTAANAWWGPFDRDDRYSNYNDIYNRAYSDAFSDFMSDLMGDGEFTINIRAKARGKGKGRGRSYGDWRHYGDWRGYNGYYNGYAPYYGGYAPPRYGYGYGYRADNMPPQRAYTNPRPPARQSGNMPRPMPAPEFKGPDPDDMAAWREHMVRQMQQRRQQMMQRYQTMMQQRNAAGEAAPASQGETEAEPKAKATARPAPAPVPPASPADGNSD